MQWVQSPPAYTSGDVYLRGSLMKIPCQRLTHGRLDDGLGAAFAEAMEQIAPPGVDISADYQLTIEDAADVAEHDFVIFVDAAVDALPHCTGLPPFFRRKRRGMKPKEIQEGCFRNQLFCIFLFACSFFLSVTAAAGRDCP